MNNKQHNAAYKNNYFNVCKNLILSDLIIFKQNFLGKCINLTIWVVLSLFIVTYVMPKFGLANMFGVFQFGGMLAAVGLFELYASVVEFVADLQSDRVIDYNLTLPISSWFVIATKAMYYFIIYFVMSMVMLPLGKLMLWNQFDLGAINYFQLFLALIFQNMFYACLVIWAASMIDNMSQLGNVWSRCVFPMWFMGGFQFSWMALYSVSPLIAWIDLCNPMIYITESMRIAMLGQAGYLNFWLCLGVIFIFSVISFILGLWNLRKRLDFI